MHRTGVLHRDERVAFEHETWDAHQQCEEVVVERLGLRAEEARPDHLARAKTERTAGVNARRGDRLDELALVETNDAAPVAAGERERGGEPVADDGHLGIRVYAIAI